MMIILRQCFLIYIQANVGRNDDQIVQIEEVSTSLCMLDIEKCMQYNLVRHMVCIRSFIGVI